MATRKSASNRGSLRQGGGCEALGGSSSFTQNYLFKQYYKPQFITGARSAPHGF